ncbi:unnamed protein product [Rhizoctonia solani]|uniref:Uncharacterized protein n=1 Tax=Rhizoctonia solani TaxID=456999 RepID=A0A8H3E7W2_9AGAM|nr:unnamed protein product [Rhizoctonia solani]
MAAADPPAAQQPAALHEANVGPVPPAAPGNELVPPAMQIPANPVQGAHAPPPLNVVGHNHQVVQVPVEPVIPTVPLPGLGVSPLLRSLYGWPLGN